jgi:DNA repair exonuclease SbcCD ATPase subunit
MTYLTNIAFYLTLKAENITAGQDHPVLDTLVKARSALETLEEMEEAGMDTLVQEFEFMLEELENESLEEDEEKEEKKKKKKKKKKKEKEEKSKKNLKKTKQQRKALEQQLEEAERWMEEYADDLNKQDSVDALLPDTEHIPMKSKSNRRKRKIVSLLICIFIR